MSSNAASRRRLRNRHIHGTTRFRDPADPMKPRTEYKLRLDRHNYAGFPRWLQQQGATRLHSDRIVYSTYFDAQRLQMLQDTDEGIVPRKKIRIRCYGIHTASCGADHRLEVKQTTERQCLKEMRECPDWQCLQSTGIFNPDYRHCRAIVSVEYQRSYYQVHEV